MGQAWNPALKFAISGIASAVATFVLLNWGARETAVSDGPANEGSRAPIAVIVETRTTPSAPASMSPEETDLARALAADPAAALRSAAELRAADERRRAVLLVGKQWTWTDPPAALAAAATLPLNLRADYRASVSREWANLDAEGFLRFADGAADPEDLIGGLELLIPSDPVRVLEIVVRLGNELTTRNLIQLTAASAIAEQDVMLALRSIERVPRGNLRDFMLDSLATIHGSKDPDAALAWLESLDSPSPTLQAAVYRGIALIDFGRGYDLLTQEIDASLFGGIVSDSSLASAVAQDTASTSRIAATLLDLGTDRAGQILEEVAAVWARRDPASLADWMLENAAAIDPRLASTIGLGVATNDLASALRLVDGLPPAIGDAWVPQIARSYARQDPLAALDWVDRYQGQPFYEEARAQAVLQAVERDPELVASMLPGMPAPLQVSAVPNIATAWAGRDPRAAADWVAGLEGPAAVPRAANEVVRGWMRQDLDAATQWALDLPRGPMRDDALNGLIGGSYGVDLDLLPIFEEIESPDLRRNAASLAVSMKSTTNPEIARAFLETLLGDAELGEWARERLERLSD